MKMILKKLFFPGKFDDAYVYMGWLHLFGTDRNVVSLNLEEICASIESDTPGAEGAAIHLFARNDWLAGGPYKSLMRNDAMRNSFEKAIDALPDVYEIDPTKASGGRENELLVESGAFLDARFYGQRMYVATSKGLFDIHVRWDRELDFDKSRKRLDMRCMSIAAGYGAVSASCGENGLFVYLNELEQPTNRVLAPELARAGTSLRTGWIGFDLVSYGGGGNALYYRGDHDKAPANNNQDRNVLTDLNENGQELLGRASPTDGLIARKDIRFMFQSTNFLYTQNYKGDLVRTGITPSDQGPVFRQSKNRGEIPEILGASAFKEGLLVETYEAVLLLHNDQQITSLLNKPALSARTYASSKRFQRLASITEEDGVWLIAALESLT